MFAFLCLAACGSPLDQTDLSPNESVAAAQWGQVSFALTAESQGSRYALRDAEFTVTGAESLSINSNDAPDASSLLQELESGEYTIELLPGYRLVELSAQGETEVEANLETPNPQTLLIAPNQTTPVTFLFRTASEAIPFGDGSVEITVSVEQTAAAGLFFSELMLNPAGVADTAGEWLEISNTADATIDLNGCVIARDSSSFAIDVTLPVAPGVAVTLANGDQPGFIPDHIYSSLTLPNNSPFVLTLECGGREWDRLEVDPTTFPIVSGSSTALSADRYSSADNDEPSFWCLATETYGLDYGTPGQTNPTCTHNLL